MKYSIGHISTLAWAVVTAHYGGARVLKRRVALCGPSSKFLRTGSNAVGSRRPRSLKERKELENFQRCQALGLIETFAWVAKLRTCRNKDRRSVLTFLV
jgi:hypothetical protein